MICDVLSHTSQTPHGPAEIVDVLTHKVAVEGKTGIAAFILKGRSFRPVKHQDIAHQIYRLEKISALKFAIFAAVGDVLDAGKEQFISTAERLGVSYALMDANDVARLALAYGFYCPRDAKRIQNGRCECGYSPTHEKLNVLQQTSLKELSTAHQIGQRSGLIVLPTGSGKTRIAAQDARAFDAQCVLYLAHRHEILDVAQDEYTSVFGIASIQKIESKEDFSRLKRINLSTTQFITRHLESMPEDAFDYIVVDEFHHAAAPGYKKLLSRVRPRFLLGMTATPFRLDRQDIAKLCDGNILAQFELRSGIDSGILAPYHYYGCFDNIDYSKIPHQYGRYRVRDLEKFLIIPERDEAIINMWRKKADLSPTLAFCCSHEHAKRMARRFVEAGISADVYLSTTEREKRRSLVSDLATGHIKVLCTVDVLNEGVDIPFIECLLFLRPTESKRVFLQQLGRGLRKSVGKSHCTVIDFIGNFKNAYKIVEYQGLTPEEVEEPSHSRQPRTAKEVLNLPAGCKVEFDDRVIDIFIDQTMMPRYANRYNISRILIYEYQKLARNLGRQPKKKDVNMYCLLGSQFYESIFGSWRSFEKQVSDSLEL